MRTFAHRSLDLLGLVLLCVSALGCQERDVQPRCPVCGMVANVEGFAVVEVDGPSRFDSPRCAFQYRDNTAEARFRFTEYYSGTLREEAALRFVVDSDVIGPMGPDRIPVAPEQVERFVQDHGGRVVDP